tara:strand:- start:123 stop:638 length:516 start_codon:yes stop_codon:yes gene_type:complete
MKEMKSEIKEIRAICGGVVEDSKKLDDYIPIEIFYLDGGHEINCTPFPLIEPVRYSTNCSTLVNVAWQDKMEKKRKVISSFEVSYAERFPRKYYERKLAISMKERNLENKRFTLNKESVKLSSEVIRFAMPSMCSVTFSANKNWLQNVSGWNQRVKINAEVLKDGKIQKSI